MEGMRIHYPGQYAFMPGPEDDPFRPDDDRDPPSWTDGDSGIPVRSDLTDDEREKGSVKQAQRERPARKPL